MAIWPFSIVQSGHVMGQFDCPESQMDNVDADRVFWPTRGSLDLARGFIRPPGGSIRSYKGHTRPNRVKFDGLKEGQPGHQGFPRGEFCGAVAIFSI